jgi:cytochrome b-561
MAVHDQIHTSEQDQSTPHSRPGWIEERLGLSALFLKYGRKAFPVHSTFFLGEMALFSFIILVLTGAYLGFVYIPSNADVTINGETMPEAYASVRLIESIPVANLFRNVHHWAAHVMIASVLLHLIRIYFTGSYRKPREINWIIGTVLLGLTLMAGFVGYALPYDSYAVTATGIGFSIARSIPWIGEFASELFFGGAFPTLGSLSRLYTIHVFILPALITVVTSLHLMIIIKQKHTQPGYARKIAEPGKVLGVPLIPYQALLAGQLFFLMFGALFLLSAFVPPHPLEDFGPPQAASPEVKPDWYLLWVYGFLKIVPADITFTFLGGTFGPDFIGGLLFPALVFGVLTFAPWMDRTNRRTVRRYEYLEPLQQSPVRTAVGIAMLTFIGTLFVAAYYDQLGLSLRTMWAIVVAVPTGVGVLTALFLYIPRLESRFDPRESLEATSAHQRPPVSQSRPSPKPTGPATPDERLPLVETTMQPERPEPRAVSGTRMATIASRGDRARDQMVNTLHEMGELAPLIRQLDNDEDLLEVLDYVESLRATLANANDTLQGVVRAHREDEDTWDTGADRGGS